jgi:hypothetical protein
MYRALLLMLLIWLLSATATQAEFPRYRVTMDQPLFEITSVEKKIKFQCRYVSGDTGFKRGDEVELQEVFLDGTAYMVRSGDTGRLQARVVLRKLHSQ